MELVGQNKGGEEWGEVQIEMLRRARLASGRRKMVKLRMEEMKVK